MECKADLETIDHEIKESTSTSDLLEQQASQSADTFFSTNEYASMDEGFDSFEPSLELSTMNITDNKFSTPQKTESTIGLPDVINSVESKTKEIAKSLEHLDFSAMSARHSTPQKFLNKTTSCLDMNRRLEFSPVKSQSLGKGIDTPYPHSLTELGLSPRCHTSNTDVFKAFFENYTYDTFKKVMKKMKRSRMTAAEAKLRTVIDEMETAINKSMEDCSEPVSSQVLKHINKSKSRRNKSRHSDVTVKEKRSEDANEENSLHFSSDNRDALVGATPIYEDYIKTVPKEEAMLLKDNRFSFKVKTNSPATEGAKARDLTYQIVKDFQSLASIASYNTTLESSLFDDIDLVNEPLRYRYSSYEEVSGVNANTENGPKFIRKHIHINEQIIKQITKLMKYAHKHQHNFLGSFVHLEGERIFLLAKTRRDALLTNLYKVPKPINETSATIIVEKLICRFNISENLNRLQLDTFFLCILEHKATVYSTTVKVLNAKGCINFGGHFIFENVSNTFNIKVSVYSLTVKTGTTSCVNFALLRRRPQLPMMSLIGVARIGLLNAKYRTFSLRNAENVLRPEYKLHAAVEANLNWPTTFKTFLTVGSTRTDEEPTWTRKWCVLEDGQMKFYTTSSDEMFSNPINVMDVRECQSVECSPIKYSNTSALMLVFNDDQEDKIFVSADTEDDVCVLLNKIKGILKLKDEWIALKK